MAKPSEVPDWATDTNYSGTGVPGLDGTPTKTEPTSGRKAQGWVPTLKQGAQGDNWWRNLVGQWCDYLNQNDFEVIGNLKVDGTTELVGNAKCDGTLEVVGATQLDSTLEVAGAATITGTLYTLAASVGVISWSRADGLASAGVTGRNLITTGAWQWIGPVFGVSGDFVTALAFVTDSSSVADTITWELHRLTINTITGAITDTTVDSNSHSFSSGAQWFTVSPASESTGNEPLSTLQSYYVKLSGAASGVVLGAGGLRIATTRPLPI